MVFGRRSGFFLGCFAIGAVSAGEHSPWRSAGDIATNKAKAARRIEWSCRAGGMSDVRSPRCLAVRWVRPQRMVRIMHHACVFLRVRRTDARRRSVRRDRCEDTRCATRLGLICLSAARRGARPRGPWAGSQQAERHGSEQCPLRATRRQLDADARDVLDHARADLDQALPDGRELALGERVRLRDRGAHAMHQPERGGVQDEPHLIGGRAVTRHAVRRQLRLVQLDQVLHLPALAIDGLVKMH